MKKFITISLVFLGLLSSCSDEVEGTIDPIEPQEEITVVKTYTLETHYHKEEPIVLERNEETLYMIEVLQSRSSRIVDTLTIDLTNASLWLSPFKYLFFGRHSDTSSPSAVSHEYITVNYLNIIGPLDKVQKIWFDDRFYDRSYSHPNTLRYGIKVDNSNVSLDYLNSISYTE